MSELPSIAIVLPTMTPLDAVQRILAIEGRGFAIIHRAWPWRHELEALLADEYPAVTPITVN